MRLAENIKQTRNKSIFDHKGNQDDDSDIILSGFSHHPFLLPSSLLGLVRENVKEKWEPSFVTVDPHSVGVVVAEWGFVSLILCQFESPRNKIHMLLNCFASYVVLTNINFA